MVKILSERGRYCQWNGVHGNAAPTKPTARELLRESKESIPHLTANGNQNWLSENLWRDGAALRVDVRSNLVKSPGTLLDFAGFRQGVF